MITGAVSRSYEAVIPLSVIGPSGLSSDIEAMIDTGFTGSFLVPRRLVWELALPFVTTGHATLADGSEQSFDVHEVTVLWDGHPRAVHAYVAEARPLVGMQMLEGHDLHVRVRAGGPVTIEAEA